MNTYNNLIQLKKDTQEREIYVWGAKITGGAMCSVLRREGFENVKAIIDSNILTHGKQLYGFEIISPQIFWDTYKDATTKPFVIVAAAIKAKEIFNICEEHGLKEEIDYCWADDLLGPVYEIDITNACNLQCPSCPQSNYKKHTAAKMTLEKFENIVKHIKKDTPNVAYIPLFCWTEPLLNKDLAQYFEILKREGILGIISTNFSLEVPHLEEIIKLQPEYFRVSFSGYTQETYERAHRGGNITLVKSNMYKLRYLLDKYSPNTFVEIYYHEYNYSPPAELELWKEICEELSYTIFNHSATINPIENQINIVEGKQDSNLDRVLETLKFKFESNRFPDLRQYPEICYSYKNMFCITALGKVIACDCVYDEERALLAENIEKVTYEELMKRKATNPICVKCLELGIPLYSGAISSNPKKNYAELIEKLKHK